MILSMIMISTSMVMISINVIMISINMIMISPVVAVICKRYCKSFPSKS